MHIYPKDFVHSYKNLVSKCSLQEIGHDSCASILEHAM